ncbi:alkaline-phosphatase-like protein [Xylaria acuta]|nr:alkaline-phosphatase-like protein [Xylaria acuta]
MYRHHVVPFSTIFLVAANLLLPVAVLIFATGFFPYKPFLPGLARHEKLDYGSPPDAPFDKLIFMVVDALRSDFVYLDGSGFEYTRSLINHGVAIPFTAHATSPTITMPRIKAMTTGTTPSFLDAILSFDEADTSSTLASQDTWLAQMRAKNTGKLIMYGDDTWLKLFPATFDRADGTTSFFVSDFTEVDNNVTRHIADELVNDDWNTMVLHYLGLDHIGHKTGPRGPNMIPKQREMDNIVRQIYGAMEANEHLRSALLVLCGDHGMNDAGNHGASSPGETSAALVFVSPKLKTISGDTGDTKAPAKFTEDFQYYSTVEQSDLAPTLAALLGFPVPKNSLGAFIPDFLPLWPKSRDKLQILIRNARQVLAIVTATLGGSFSEGVASEQECLHPSSSAVELVCEWHRISEVAEQSETDSAQHQGWLSDISRWLSGAQMLMSGMASNYDIDKLILGETITAAAVFAAGVATTMSTKMTIRNFVPFALVTLLYGVMMFASSYVEEEQHFWYWSTTAWLFYLVVNRAPRLTGKFLVMTLFGLGMMRLTRGWNQTGQKFSGESDIVTTFLLPNPTLLWVLVWFTYFLVSRELLNDLDGIPTMISGSVVAGVVTSAVSFKLTFTKQDAPELVVGLARILADFFDGPSLVTQARAVFMGIGLTAIYPLYLLCFQPTKSSKKQAVHAMHHLYTLFALTQSRATNAPLFLLFRGIYFFLNELNLGPIEVTTTSLLLQFASFFAMGGSNAFTGIDLSSAYNGVSDFNVFAVGALTFVSNWAGPVWWTSTSNLLLLSSRAKATSDKRRGSGETTGDVFTQHASLLTLYTAASLGSVMVACTALRTHLFIWTVFSPKYLYSMAWSLGQHLVINMGLGGLLYWLGRT